MSEQLQAAVKDVVEKHIHMSDKYNKLLAFVEQLADESVYEKYENLNELNCVAFNLIKEIGEE